MENLKVSAHSVPSAVAGAIAKRVKEIGSAEIHAIGAGATNQAVKAIAAARTFLKADKIDLICYSEFVNLIIDNESKTAIKFVCEPR